MTETKTVSVYVPQYMDYDFSNIRCGQVIINEGQTWLEVVINHREMNETCLADIETIKRTLNGE